jgi:hypothetical protein
MTSDNLKSRKAFSRLKLSEESLQPLLRFTFNKPPVAGWPVRYWVRRPARACLCLISQSAAPKKGKK